MGKNNHRGVKYECAVAKPAIRIYEGELDGVYAKNSDENTEQRGKKVIIGVGGGTENRRK